MTNPLYLLPETECSCLECQSMCTRPCWGTPENIQKLIDAGFGNRLYADYWCGRRVEDSDINMIQPALKDFEHGIAPFWPRTEKGCTFWKDGLCELHDKGLKPIEGKLADCSKNSSKLDEEKSKYGMTCHEMVARTWDSEEGRTLYENWIKTMPPTMDEE